MQYPKLPVQRAVASAVLTPLLLAIGIGASLRAEFSATAHFQASPAASASASGGETLRMVPPVGHSGWVNGIAFSPDGKLAVTGSKDTTLRLWDVATRREIRAFTGHESEVYSVAYSPDGRHVLSGSLDNTMRLWDVRTGREVRRFTGHKSFVNRVAFSPDGRQAVSISDKARFWDVATGREVRALPDDRSINGIAFSPDGKHLLTAEAGNAVRSQDGTRIVSGEEAGIVRLWDAATGGEVRAFRGHTDDVNSVAFSPDGKQALSGGKDKTIRLWDVATGQEIRRFTGHTGAVGQVVFMSNGAYAFSRSGDAGDKTVRLWEVATGTEKGAFRSDPSFIQTIAVDPGGWKLIAALSNYTVQMWDLRTGAVAGSLRQRESLYVGRAALSPDARYALSAGEPGPAWLWEVGTGRPVRRLVAAADSYVRDTTFSPDGRLALVSDPKGLVLWDVAAAREVRTLPESYGPVAFSRDGRYVAGTGVVVRTEGVSEFVDGRLVPSTKGVKEAVTTVWEIATGNVVQRFNWEPGELNEGEAVAFGPDNKSVYRSNGGFMKDGDLHAVLRKWDVATGKEVQKWTFPERARFHFSPDGRQALVSFQAIHDTTGGKNLVIEKPALLWDLAAGREARQIPWIKNSVRSAVFSPDGQNVLSAVGDAPYAVLWDTATGRELRRLEGHSHWITALSRSADGKRALSASGDSTQTLWDTTTGRPIITYLYLKSGDWLAYTPDGRFDGSEGAVEKVHFARGLQTFALEQFRERFFTPDLVPLVLAGEQKATPVPGQTAVATAEEAVAKGTPPVVRIVSPTPGKAGAEQTEVVVEAVEQNQGGIKAVKLFHNGRRVGGPSSPRGIVVEAATPNAADALTKRFTVTLTPGENVFSAVAYSQTDLESQPAQVTVQYAPPQPPRPVLHVLTVGINRYRDPGMTLNYARPDAEALGKFFTGQGASAAGLFDAVKVTSLMDTQATGQAIQAALEKMAADSKPDDIVFLYLAGHGENAPAQAAPNAEEMFFFLPHEMQDMANKEKVRTLGLSASAIWALLAKVPARKIVLVYDACKAGGAVKDSAFEKKVFSRIADGEGIHVMMAATQQQAAGELRALGHGVFTYALLEGLRGKAASTTADRAVKVIQLTTFVEDRLPELTKQYQAREQRPVFFRGGQNFPLVTAQ